MKLQEIIKRQFDFWFSLIGLIILSPVFLVLAILIKINSPGPVFFKQDRVGKNGKIFKIWKFRTMPVGSDKIGLSALKIREFEIAGNDPRINKFNRFLRKFALDELPQLINIFKGDMSFVGPRPFIPERVATNKRLLERTTVKPGMASLLVINGGVSLSDDELIKLDLEYIQKQNFWLDMKILFKTVTMVLTGKVFSGK